MILLRHGQSLFNVHFAETRVDPGIPDPCLTEEGRRQAAAAAATLKNHGIEHLIASPYQRTLETAEIVAETLDLPIHVNPLVRERCYFHCDIGSPRAALQARFPHVHFAALEERWWPELNETEEELMQRVGSFRAEMRSHALWRRTAVVTHWGFIRGMTGHEVGNGALVAVDLEETARAGGPS